MKGMKSACESSATTLKIRENGRDLRSMSRQH